MTLTRKAVWYGVELPVRVVILGPFLLVYVAGAVASAVARVAVGLIDQYLPSVRG